MTPHYHFIAIGGIGMSGLARILIERGFTVSGSDSQRSPLTDNLEKAGAKIFIGYCPSNLPRRGIVVYSTFVVKENTEFEAAKSAGFPLMHRSRLLAQLMEGKKSLLVAGTHGKTTTSSLLTHILYECGYDPSYSIGGILSTLNSNGGEGKGEYFIAEACESDGTFLEYPRFGGIVTNIDNDHLDFWKTEKSLIRGFAKFLKPFSSKEHLFYCADDQFLTELSPQALSYGFSEKANARITEFSQEGFGIRFSLSFRGKDYPNIQASLIGRHNALNTAAVFALSVQLGIPEEPLRKALMNFKGIGRRVEKRGEISGITIFDDYGHHPTEIATTLEGLKKAIGERRLVAIFQPHRYTRTRDCMEEFAGAFAHADLLCITDIYAAGEAPIPGIDTPRLLEKIRKKQEEKVRYFSRPSLTENMLNLLQKGDVVVTIGAGDVTKIGPELLLKLT